MRTYVEVIGIGKRRQGVSKRSGVKYDMTEISFAYEEKGFTGRKCETVAVNSEVIGERAIAPGDVLDVVMHQANFKTYVDAIL